MLTIVNYGVGNLMSIKNILKRVGIDSLVSNRIEDIKVADKLILPGVGNFDYCMQQLRTADFYDSLQERVLNDKVPILGICVGCQMMMDSSEEGTEPGMGWLKGKVIKFNKERLSVDYKIPHMGWSDIMPMQACQLYSDIAEPRFYFVHSYHVETDDESVVTATANYGYQFTASVGSGHIHGVQFHPEKSHRFGMQLYSNFAKLES